MFKINLTGAQETVHLSEVAGILCAARDIETMGEVISGLSESEDVELNLNELAKALAQEVIEGWYGLGDEEGQPIEFNPDLVPAVMADPVVLQAFRAQYLTRLLYMRDEGNGSSPLQNGTSGAGATIAKDASAPARRAPTKRSSRKPKKANKSGA